jgi:hypothetical protein
MNQGARKKQIPMAVSVAMMMRKGTYLRTFSTLAQPNRVLSGYKSS